MELELMTVKETAKFLSLPIMQESAVYIVCFYFLLAGWCAYKSNKRGIW